MSSRRSLVTGGGGFIGSHLVRQLQQNGDIVRVLELPDVPLPSNVETVRGPICDVDVVRTALKCVHGSIGSIIWQPTQIYRHRKKVTLIA